MYLLLIGCCFLSLLIPVLQIIFQHASWVRFSVAALAESHRTSWCQRRSGVSEGDLLHEVPVILHDSELLASCWGVCGALTSWGGKEEEDDDE